jgi:hypothetical protein
MAPFEWRVREAGEAWSYCRTEGQRRQRTVPASAFNRDQANGACCEISSKADRAHRPVASCIMSKDAARNQGLNPARSTAGSVKSALTQAKEDPAMARIRIVCILAIKYAAQAVRLGA